MSTTLDQSDALEAAAPTAAIGARRINTRGLSLRSFAARGMIINTLFEIALSGLSLVRGFILAALLTRADFGVWGILVASLGVLSRIKVVGIGDKYIQQNESDQELEFQRAFTFEMLMTAGTAALLLAALPVFAVVYGQWKIVPPGICIVLLLFGGALQMPFWVYYREMDFVRQRLMAAINPVVSTVVAVGLAAAGFGYWALAVGTLAGTFSAAAFAVSMSRYPLRWRYSKGALQIYKSYSGPLLISIVCSIVLAYTGVIAVNATLGLAAVGVVAFCANITAFTTRVDDLVSGTLYPAVCAVQERLDLLRESFVKSNRLALMWAMPFGCGLALFAHDLIHFLVGDRWLPAAQLLQITGVVAAIGHIGFNWDDYLRARSYTRPVAVEGVAAATSFVLIGLPLILALGLEGLAIGTGVQAVVALCFRGYYLAKIFEGFVFVRHAMRAMLPTLPAIVVVVVQRQFEQGPRTVQFAIADLITYVSVTVLATWLFERSLIREAVGYVTGIRRRAGAAVA